MFRDSGLPGDSFCEALVRSVPGHLGEGGIAHLLVSWAHAADGDWTPPLRACWIDGNGCDAVFLHHSSHEPLGYANEHNRIHSRARRPIAARSSAGSSTTGSSGSSASGGARS